jgi:hypothetical protein
MIRLALGVAVLAATSLCADARTCNGGPAVKATHVKASWHHKYAQGTQPTPQPAPQRRRGSTPMKPESQTD